MTFNVTQLHNNTRKSYSICILIEHWEGIRNAAYITLFFAFFFQSLCEHANYEEIFKEKGAVPNSCDMAEDIETSADDKQRKGRTTRAKENAITPIGTAKKIIIIIQSNFIVLFNKILNCYLRTGYIILILEKLW